MTTANKPDEFDALRTIIEALKPFDQAEQRRLIRWVQEKLGIVISAPAPSASSPGGQSSIVQEDRQSEVGHSAQLPATDIRTFINEKSPSSDNQFTAAIAYYYQFEAPEAERKSEINSADLISAARLAQYRRPPKASQTLINAHHAGLLDHGSGTGMYKLSSVGENLVAMVLPGSGNGGTPKRKAKKAKGKSATKKSAKKKA